MSSSVWIEAARPKTLWAAVAPVLLGIALAVYYGVFHPLAAILALTGAVLIQVATNFHNDVSDHAKGADGEGRTGPVRAVASGAVTPRAMQIATVVTFAAAIASGVYLMWRGGLPIILIGVLSILFGLLYTGGTYSLSYLGIADGFVLVFFGPIAVAGTFYVQALDWPLQVWVAGIGPGLLSVAILMVNNIRDVKEDAQSGKRTIVVRLGRTFGVKAYAACQVGAALVPLVLWRLFDAPATVLLALLWLPLALSAHASLAHQEGQALNPILGRTARNLLIYCLLLSLGWLFMAGR